MKFTGTLLFLVVLAVVAPPAEASCSPPSYNRPFFGYSISLQTPNADNLLGSFWALGYGDPVVGMGHDNGTWPAVYGGYYGWVRYGSYIYGDWGDPPYGGTIDGCISDLPTPDDRCMAILWGRI